jgi:hypothetical protein
VYTFYDTCTDLYVTLCITTVLIMHVQKVKHVNISANINLFIAIGATNILRTIVLMISNLVSAILILKKVPQVVIMIAWPIINLLFILLVGYDTDIARLIRKAQHTRSHTYSSTSCTGLTPDPKAEYSLDKIPSSQLLQISSQQRSESIYQLQPTHTPHSHSSQSYNDTGPSASSRSVDDEMLKDA